MEEFKPVSGKYLMYKNQPLVREGNTLCYGDKTEKCFLILDILSYKNVDGQQVPDNISIQIVDSKNPGNIIKHGDKSGLNTALEMGMIWLDRANKQ